MKEADIVGLHCVTKHPQIIKLCEVDFLELPTSVSCGESGQNM